MPIRWPTTAWLAASAHDWPEATRQVKAAIAECGDCAAKADLHKNSGLIDCQAGDLNNGERNCSPPKALKPTDPEIQRALQLIAEARNPAPGLRHREGILVAVRSQPSPACRRSCAGLCRC